MNIGNSKQCFNTETKDLLRKIIRDHEIVIQMFGISRKLSKRPRRLRR